MEKLKNKKVTKVIITIYTIILCCATLIISISANTIEIEGNQAQRTPFGFSEMVTGRNVPGAVTKSTDIIHETEDWFIMDVGDIITNDTQTNSLTSTSLGTKYMEEWTSVQKVTEENAYIRHHHEQKSTVDEFYRNGMVELQSQYMVLTSKNIPYLEQSSITIYNEKWDFNEWTDSIDPENEGLATKVYFSYRVLYPSAEHNYGSIDPIIKNEVFYEKELTNTTPIVVGNNVIGREYVFTNIFSDLKDSAWNREFSNNGAVLIYDIKLLVVPTTFESMQDAYDKITIDMVEVAHREHASDISLITNMNFKAVATTTVEDVDFLSWILSILDKTFNFEIISGVKIGMIIWFVMGLSLLFVTLKMFMGG